MLRTLAVCRATATLVALLGVAQSSFVFADARLDALAERIATALTIDKGYPRDASMYKDHVIYGHSTGPERDWPVQDFLAASGAEMSSIGRFLKDENISITHVIAEGDTIVIKLMMTGVLPDQSAFSSKMVLFVTIEDWLMSRLELWADPVASKRLEDFMAKDLQMKAPSPNH